MNTIKTKCPKFLATLATIAISCASPAFAETGEGEKDEDARQLKFLFQELAIDPEDLTRDSLNKDLIKRPDRFRPNDITGNSLNRSASKLDDFFAPNLERSRGNLTPGFAPGITDSIDGSINRLASGSYTIIIDGKAVTIDYISREEGSADTAFWNDLYKNEYSPIHSDTWVSKEMADSARETYGADGFVDFMTQIANEKLDQDKKTEEEKKKNEDEEEDEEDEEDEKRDALGGNDNQGGKAGPLNEFRPVSDGTNGTIRFGKSDPKGGELEGETGNSNGGLSTLRFAPGTEERIKASRAEDYNAGVLAFIQEMMNGGGGFDPSGWDDTDDGNGFGEIQGNIGGGSL